MMPKRYVHLRLHIDTNRINSRGKLQNMKVLEKWHSDGVISLLMSKTAHGEAISNGDPKRRLKASSYIHTHTCASTTGENNLLKQIENILFRNGAKTPNEINDVEVVFNAKKYSAILITNDGGSKKQPGGILGNADKLKVLGITVMRDFEAVAYVKELIKKRDEYAIKVANLKGLQLPDWVGKD